MDLIYCAAGNQRFMEIAVAAGYRYGAQLPRTVYGPLYFVDQDWTRPNRSAYLAALAAHRPHMATVLDWERPDQLSEVLGWAEDAAAFVDRVLIIPKVIGGIDQIPRQVGGKPVVLAYSVPTTYGGTPIHPCKFVGWPVHLLGGSPPWQMRLWRYFRQLEAEGAPPTPVVSVDGNYAQKLATGRCQFWVPGTATAARNRWAPTLQEADGQRWAGDGPAEAFRRSCVNIIAAWRQLTQLPLLAG